MARDSCLARVTAGAASVAPSAAPVGECCYGTYEAVRYKVHRETTLGSAAIFGLFLGAGSLIHCGKSY
ncbi:unnamed protein product [Spirodela intermedia]|uniref:Uncharacterized protein n=1 Tax=Spirodela intermedia TaxID=51605 RepID=A0A7I8JFR8_SPIIN|nr:unnamed protein product [Spirodela intermedia]CAA6668994.1 unnamed protein product [Spirodela intermedia]